MLRHPYLLVSFCLTFGTGILGNGLLSGDEGVPDFETQVMPVFTKFGCNSAACHGAAIGRGGFHLSLLGYDPQSDHGRIVHQYQGRRTNTADPEKSLVLLKPSRQLRHGGGRRFRTDSEAYQILRSWLAAGAPRSTGRHIESLSVTPGSQVLGKVGDQFQLQVVAKFDDGTQADVTRWAVYNPNDGEAVKCSRGGEVTAKRRGQSSVMVRYLGQVGCVMVTVPLDKLTDSQGQRPRANFIDEHVNRTLDQLGLDHSPAAPDATFARRIYLDLIGCLPTPAEVDRFVSDSNPQKRERLIDELMTRPEFVDLWSYKWGDLLRVESGRLSRPGAEAFHRWVRQKIARNTPLDEMARQLVMAQGDSFEAGEANFHRVAQNPVKQAEYFSGVFLGVRLQCANCHNHPLDSWTQDDFHGLAAIFAGLSREQVVKPQGPATIIHPRTGRPATQRLPGQRYLQESEEPRKALGDWLTAENNPFFARTAVNRIWRDLMGRGLVEPIDDHRATNPATHPELLSSLAQDFVEHGFDVKHAIKTIVLSAAYQRSSLSQGNNKIDDRFYAKALVRPLPPTVIVDAVSTVTSVPEKFTGYPGLRAIELGDARIRSEPLELLGRCDRRANCDAPDASPGSSLSLMLHIINGKWLNEKIEDQDGRLRTQLQTELSIAFRSFPLLSTKTNAELINLFYQLAYSRKPDQAELDHWEEKLTAASASERQEKYQDFVWALLNSAEFCCNH